MSIFERLFNAITTIVRGQMTKEEVNRALAEAAAKHPERGLKWNESIVDLLKVLDLDSGFQARKELAEELGYEGEFTGSAEQNTKLHQATMERIAKRCVEVPKE